MAGAQPTGKTAHTHVQPVRCRRPRPSRRSSSSPPTSSRRRQAEGAVAHRHRAREVRLPPPRLSDKDYRLAALRARRHPRAAGRACPGPAWEEIPDDRPADRAERRRGRTPAPPSRWSRAASSSCRAPLATLHDTKANWTSHCATVSALAADLGIGFAPLGYHPTLTREGSGVDAQEPLRHHAALHGPGRDHGPGHDAAHLHRAGEPGLR